MVLSGTNFKASHIIIVLSFEKVINYSETGSIKALIMPFVCPARLVILFTVGDIGFKGNQMKRLS